MPNQLSIDHDRFIPGLSDLASAIKGQDARAFIQLHHAGRKAISQAQDPVAPSSVVWQSPYSNEVRTPRELSIEEIKILISKFAEAALRAKKAGFDGIEIHGAHGYLISSFLSRFLNRRLDQYGLGLQGRIRFLLETIACIQGKVGQDYPITCRINGDDYIDGGNTVEDATAIARQLENAGVNGIVLGIGISESQRWMTAPMRVPQGFAVHLSEAIKRTVQIPVVAAGRINDPLLAEQILRDGKADLIGMARGLTADPELPLKAKQGRLQDIRKCIGCNTGCLQRLVQGLRASCTVNASIGREAEFSLSQTAAHPRKVLIVGGGPAGLEAARIARLRNHEVTLFEKEPELGGLLKLASIPPHKETLNELKDYLTSQVHQLGIKVHLGEKPTIKTIEALKPDVVIIAAGSNYERPDQIRGIDQEHVFSYEEILGGAVQRMGKKIVIGGGGQVGCETAEYLAAQGADVTVIMHHEQIAYDVEPLTRSFLIERLKELKVNFLTDTHLEEITPAGVIFLDKKWRRRTIEADSIIISFGRKPNRDLTDQLEKRGKFAVHAIGDCAGIGNIQKAIHEGASIAYSL